MTRDDRREVEHVEEAIEAFRSVRRSVL